MNARGETPTQTIRLSVTLTTPLGGLNMGRRAPRRRSDQVENTDAPSSDETECSLRHRKEVTLCPTRRQLRETAPDGILVEDILCRIVFDEALCPEAFTTLVETDDGGGVPGARWCRSFCWTGTCRFGDSCRYSHGGRRLSLWGDAEERRTIPVGNNRSALPPMISDNISNANPAHICFLLFKGEVVWGRDLGSDVWLRFVRSLRSGASEVSGTCDWSSLPQTLWTRIFRGLPAESLVSGALALGHLVNVHDVTTERWPVAENASLVQLASLVEASRLTAHLLHFRAATAADLNMSSPLDRCLEGLWKRGVVCPAVKQWTEALGEPTCIRFDTQVVELRFGASLLVARALGGEMRVVRRSDQKQVASLKVRDASSFDCRAECLAVGCMAPARLQLYDLSEAAPKMVHQLKFDPAPPADVTFVSFVDSETCVCQLFSKCRGCPAVVVVDCSDGLFVTHRLEAANVAVSASRCISANQSGLLSVWDVAGHGIHIVAEHTLPRWEGLPHVAGRGRYVAVGGGDAVWAYDLLDDMLRPVVRLAREVPSGGLSDWEVRHVHVEGSVLFVIAEALMAADSWSAGLSPGGNRVFSWHLPSCSPLLLDHETSLTAFAKTDCKGDVGFAVAQQREGRTTHCVIFPAALHVRQPPRRTDAAPRRSTKRGSDIRARGMRK